MFTRTLSIISCLTALLFAAQVAYAETPQVEVKLSRDSMSIGDQLTLDVVVRKDLMQIIDFPDFDKGMLNEYVHIIDESPVDTLTEGRTQTLKKRYKLTTFKAGDHNMGRFPVMYIDKNIVDTLFSADSLLLKVTTFDIDLENDKINPIKRPENTPFLGQEIFGYVVIGLIGLTVLAAAVYVIMRKLRRRRANVKVEESVSKEPPHVAAIRELEELYHKKLWQNNRHKQYYSGLTDILREYISRRYGTSVMEKTTDEIIKASEAFELDKINSERLNTLLHMADLVKFAKYIPDEDYNEKAYTDVYYFVEDTKAVEDGGDATEDGRESKEPGSQGEANGASQHGKEAENDK